MIWGNRLMKGDRLSAGASAWAMDATWGASRNASGARVTTGLTSTINVVWGSACGGADCDGPWTVEGTSDEDSVVWGTDDADSVVWGTDDGDSVVWGTTCSDPACEPVVWEP